ARANCRSLQQAIPGTHSYQWRHLARRDEIARARTRPRQTRPRPAPGALQQEEAEAKRGTLRIYFGASAGVGKTYAMLAAARKLKEEGRDVVVGVVETHGRSETA